SSSGAPPAPRRAPLPMRARGARAPPTQHRWRRSTTTLSGTGSQFGEPVTITGEGQGELLFGLRLDDGQMTDGNGVSTLTLSLTGRRKSQVVTQNARLEIRRAF
ncbi:MAG: hypothetical protein ACK5ED_01375, partial [Gemmatimonadota bacterium]